MKILVLSDIHSRLRPLRAILDSVLRNKVDPDAILIAGDLTDYGTEQEVTEVHSCIRMRFPIPPVFEVEGNCDRCILQRTSLMNVHLVSSLPVVSKGLIFGGLDWESSDGDEVASDCLESWNKRIEPCGEHPLVGMSHRPPLGSNADIRHTVHVGSPLIAEILRRTGPLVWICGHIHESASAGILNETFVINPGPAREGCFAILSIASVDGQEHGPGSVSAKLYQV